MITLKTGDLLNSPTEAIVNTVNLEGYMGKGIAYQFKLEYPLNNEEYIKACKTKDIDIGKVFVFKENKYIFNFPTKDRWRKKSEYDFIEQGMNSLVEKVREYDIKSISIPPLGCGNGGLEWLKVKRIIEDKLSPLKDEIEVFLYSPSKYYKSASKQAPKMNTSHLVLMSTKMKLKKFNKLRLQKTSFLINLFSNTNYFKYEEYKFGPYSHSIEIISKDIKEYQDFYKFSTKDAYENILRNIVSKTINEKLNSFIDPIKKATEFVNSIDSDQNLEIIITLIWLVENNDIKDEDGLIKSFYSWPKEDIARFNLDDINKCIELLFTKSIIIKTLLGFEINSDIIE